MTPDALRDLIARGETLDVEFKGEEKATLTDVELATAVACLANRSSSEFAWLLVVSRMIAASPVRARATEADTPIWHGLRP